MAGGKKFIKPDPIPFTREEMVRMKKEREKLEQQREEILLRLQAAREMGDLSENGAYKYAKFELRDTDRKLRRLNRFIRFGVVIAPTGNDRVGFGCRVRLKQGAKRLVFQVVGEHEANPLEKKLSEKSPLGKVLMGKRVGESVRVEAPAGETEYVIEAIE